MRPRIGGRCGPRTRESGAEDYVTCRLLPRTPTTAASIACVMGIFEDDPDFIDTLVITLIVGVTLCVICCVFCGVCGLVVLCIRDSTNATDQEFILAGGKGGLARAKQQREDAKPSTTQRLVGAGLSASTGGIL